MSNFFISLAHRGEYVCAEGGGGGSLAANKDEIGGASRFFMSNNTHRGSGKL